jgi:hypothetical protein
MLWGFLRTFFKPNNCFWMAFTFQGWLSVSWRGQNVQGDHAPAKRQKMLKNVRTHPWRLSPNNPWSVNGVFQEILTGNVNMRCTVAKFVPRLFTNDQKQQRVNTCLELQEKANKGLLTRHSPPMISLCFPNWNWKDSIWHPKGITSGTWQH